MHFLVGKLNATDGQSSAGEKQHKSIQEGHSIITTQFYGRAEPKRAAAAREPTQTDTWAVLRLALYIASFAFYLFTRSTTMTVKGSVPLFLYQLAFILAESLHFVSGCLIGLWQVLLCLS